MTGLDMLLLILGIPAAMAALLYVLTVLDPQSGRTPQRQAGPSRPTGRLAN